MQTHHAEVLPIHDTQHGEGACWWEARQQLIWVDILACEVHLYNPATHEDRMWKTPSHVGYAHPTQDGALVLGLQDGIARLDLRSNRITKLAVTEPDKQARPRRSPLRRHHELRWRNPERRALAV